MGYWITPSGQYYEGDRASPQDSAVPQRPAWTYDWVNGAWTPNAVRAAQKAQTLALAAGVAITSTGTPAVDGTYAVDAAQQQVIGYTQEYIRQNAAFPGGLSAIELRLVSGAMISIPNTTVAVAIFTAVANYIVSLDDALLAVEAGGAWKAPSATTTIA